MSSNLCLARVRGHHRILRGRAAHPSVIDSQRMVLRIEARERTRGSLRHAIPTLLPILREWYRVSRSRWPQRGFPSAPLAASSASRFRSPARMFPMSWFPSWQAYSYRRWSLRAMGMDTVQGFVQTVGSVIVHS